VPVDTLPHFVPKDRPPDKDLRDVVSDLDHSGVPAGTFPLNQPVHVDPGGDDGFQVVHAPAYAAREGWHHGRIAIRTNINPYSASPTATDCRIHIPSPLFEVHADFPSPRLCRFLAPGTVLGDKPIYRLIFEPHGLPADPHGNQLSGSRKEVDMHNADSQPIRCVLCLP
jgi:hypothetical protein